MFPNHIVQLASLLLLLLLLLLLSMLLIYFKMVPTWKTKKGKTSEFLDAGGYNKNERGELTIWNGLTERVGERQLIYLRHRKM